MSMRAQFVKTMTSLLDVDPSLVLLLGDIGVHGFRDVFSAHPARAYNIGILEQATVGVAAGMSKSGLVPVVHTIAPFLVERAYEQIKVDFGYQGLRGNFVSVGASYDYAALGGTHHCPGDVSVLLAIPEIDILIPGTAQEFDVLFRENYKNDKASYFRLSERENKESYNVKGGGAVEIQRGRKATVIAIGPTLQHALPAVAGMDVTLLYYTTIRPFDSEALNKAICDNGNVLVVEPFYSGSVSHLIAEAADKKRIRLESIGVPRRYLTNYGGAAEHDKAIGLTSDNILSTLKRLIDDK